MEVCLARLYITQEVVLIGNDDKTSQSQNFALLSQYTGQRIFFLMEQRQQIPLRQSAENVFGEDEEHISGRNQRILTQESGTEEIKSEGTNAPILLAEKYAQFVNQFINKPIEEQKEKT